MSHYDFRALHDKEFELLCADLIGAKLALNVETFKAGRDLGVDGRFFPATGGEGIMQSKHYLGSGFKGLFKSLKDVELAKMNRLKPVRYIVTTSLELSRLQKNNVSEALAPHILRADDVMGYEDLRDLLDKHPEILKKHTKLWLSSINVFDFILNKGINERTKDFLEQAKHKSIKYVQTKNEINVLEKIKKQKVAIICGEPGIGKTTLAEQICLIYLQENYQIFKIDSDITEAENVWKTETKQLFYFDDFLGSSYLGATTGHEGAKITNLIKRIENNSNKKLLLTTRTIILNDGKLKYQQFKNENISKNEYEIKIDSLTELEKAHILYNHIWHSELKITEIKELYKNKRYRDIISHKNFNPRLISFITDAHKFKNIANTNYWNYVENHLQNPTSVWDHLFSQQTDDCGKYIVLLITMYGRPINENVLRLAFDNLKKLGVFNDCTGSRDFFHLIEKLTGSMLNRYLNKNTNIITYNHFNPSVNDYILRKYSTESQAVANAIQALNSGAALLTLEDAFKNKIFDNAIFHSVIEILFSYKNSINMKLDSDYNAIKNLFAIRTIGKLLTNNDKNVIFHEIKNLLSLAPPVDSSALGLLCEWTLDNCRLPIDDYVKFIKNYARTSKVVSDDLLRTTYSIALKIHLTTPEEDVIDIATDLIFYAIHETLEDNIEAADIFSDVNFADYKAATKAFNNWLDDRLSDFNIGYAECMYIKKNVLNSTNIDILLDRYQEQHDDGDDEPDFDRTDYRPIVCEIDELFKRDDIE